VTAAGDPGIPPRRLAGAFIPSGGAKGSAGDRRRELAILALVALALIGGLLGAGTLWLHMTTDPLGDVRAYYDAAHRLNVGQPLYLVNGDATKPTYYFYPPLLAILMRPFALLPFHDFAVLWEVVVVASFVGLLRRLGANRRTFIALGLLGIPIGWALGIAQAHVPLTLLMAIGQPWSIAFATDMKVFPILVAIWWLGRRQFQAVGAMIGWLLILGLFQVLLAPKDWLSFFSAVGLGQVAGVQNMSPYAISPILWGVLAAAGAVGVVLAAPTRWGWSAAVAFATLASPRLLVYMLMSMLAAVREPDSPNREGPGKGDRVPDAAEALVRSFR